MKHLRFVLGLGFLVPGQKGGLGLAGEALPETTATTNDLPDDRDLDGIVLENYQRDGDPGEGVRAAIARPQETRY